MEKLIAGLPVAAALLLLACPTDAQAYLDPGTGSMVFQAAIAVTVAAIFTIKQYWGFVRAWFAAKKAPTEARPLDGTSSDGK